MKYLYASIIAAILTFITGSLIGSSLVLFLISTFHNIEITNISGPELLLLNLYSGVQLIFCSICSSIICWLYMRKRKAVKVLIIYFLSFFGLLLTTLGNLLREIIKLSLENESVNALSVIRPTSLQVFNFFSWGFIPVLIITIIISLYLLFISINIES
jgi:hypothetical protein